MSETIFFRLIEADVDAKSVLLASQCSSLREGEDATRTYVVSTQEFLNIPGIPIAYWTTGEIRRIFEKCPKLSASVDARQGLVTADDFRFLRAFWEVAPNLIAYSSEETISRRWVHFAKGGSFSPYHDDLHLVVDWKNNGLCIRNFLKPGGQLASRPQNVEYFFRPGLTWPLRTDGLSFRVLPTGCVFSHKGPAIIAQDDDIDFLSSLLAVTNSSIFSQLVQVQLARTQLAQSYEVGLLQNMPLPVADSKQDWEPLTSLTKAACDLQRQQMLDDETTHVFSMPMLGQEAEMSSLVSQCTDVVLRRTRRGEDIGKIQSEVNRRVLDLYGLVKLGSSLVDDESNQNVAEDLHTNPIDDATDDSKSISSTISDISQNLFMWCVGIVFGRWDARIGIDAGLKPSLQGIFEMLPRCSPGTLVNTLGLPATRDHIAGEAWLRARKNVLDIPPADIPGTRIDASQYPLEVAWDGILVDDPGHPDDLVARLRAVLSLIYRDRADAIYQELVDLLVGSGHDLRPYLRGAFFDFHIKRYSKSRRKAPIYWRLATPSGSYAVWLYYHRMDKDTLYKVLNDYVLPKLQHEQGRLAALQASGGDAPTAAQRKAAETQARLVEELQTFRDEVARVAPLWDPDRNDGVILNCAPLWRLLPSPRTWQAECRAAWDALCRGDYDWAHLALRLWPERVVPKCRADRSLAIAHGLDEIFWQEQATGKATPRSVDAVTVQALIASRRSVAVERALVELQDAAVAPPKPRAVTNTAAAGKGKQAKPKAADLQMGFALEE